MTGISLFVLYIKQIYEIPFPLEALQQKNRPERGGFE